MIHFVGFRPQNTRLISLFEFSLIQSNCNKIFHLLIIVDFYHFKPKTEFHLHSFFLDKGKIVKSFWTIFVNFGHGACLDNDNL